MAAKKDVQPSDSPVADMARDLFVRRMTVKGATAAWKVAVDCFADAAEFHRIADKIAGGMTPDEVIAELATKTGSAA